MKKGSNTQVFKAEILVEVNLDPACDSDCFALDIADDMLPEKLNRILTHGGDYPFSWISSNGGITEYCYNCHVKCVLHLLKKGGP